MAEKVTLARPYAEAIFESANESKDIDNWSDILNVLSELSQSDKVTEQVSNPEMSLEEKVSVFTSLGKDFLNEKAVNLVKLAAENEKLDLFPEIAQVYEALKAESKSMIDAEVISAYAVNATQKKMIIESLEKRFEKQVTISTSIDKSLIGGIIIRAGDLVIDGSVSSQLKKITQTLMR
jgi:F-type H+-transporting ATPase subunit delta